MADSKHCVKGYGKTVYLLESGKKTSKKNFQRYQKVQQSLRKRWEEKKKVHQDFGQEIGIDSGGVLGIDSVDSGGVLEPPVEGESVQDAGTLDDEVCLFRGISYLCVYNTIET